MAIDSRGDIYLTGSGQILTTPGSFQPMGGGTFVVKISLNERLVPAAAAPFVTGVLNGANFSCGFQNNSWITIRGFNLAATSRTWGAQDIIDGRLPTRLDGVSVNAGGKAAAIYYISPTQINALAPSDSTIGDSRGSVTVTNANGTSLPFQAYEEPSLGLFAFGPQNRRYAAATLADGAYLGPPGLLGAGIETKPAKPGDVILLYGTGFGAANPPVPSDRVFSGPAVLADPVSIMIGGVPATVQFAGMTGPGLCQFNVVVPNVPDGDQEVVAAIHRQIGGFPTLNLTQRNIYVNVRR
jgi:uncharacterized protein (TIGR03437 family)